MREVSKTGRFSADATARSYGRRSGVLRHVKALLAQRIGLYRDFEKIEWGEVKRLVFVCHGNICRSAYGAVIVARAGTPENAIAFDSFGLATSAGKPANDVAVSIAQNRGVDLSGHRSQRVEDFTPMPGDLLIGMEPWHGKALQDRFGREFQVTLLGLWATRMRPHLEDPYGLSKEYFETCFDIIEDAVRRILGNVNSRITKN